MKNIILLAKKNAIEKIHFPETMEEFIEARQRLVFDELFALQLTLAKRRHNFEQEEKSLHLEVQKYSAGRKIAPKFALYN